VGQFIKLDDISETSSSHSAHTSSTGTIPVPGTASSAQERRVLHVFLLIDSVLAL
jgi:hypothetical protein